MTRYIQANGNEAAALGAISAGIRYFSHYPGSPVNFVEPALRKYSKEFKVDILFNDSLNEHIAALSAGGASFSGARSMVVMKHVGLNISADPLSYLAYTGVRGGMVVVTGTDPGANSSTSELDVHWYAKMFNLPLFEPVTVSEIYRIIIEAFILSEKYNLPVLIFIPVRLAYDSELIEFAKGNNYDHGPLQFIKDKDLYINVGFRNIVNHKRLLDKIDLISKNENYLKSLGNPDAKNAIITRGLTFSLVNECLNELNLSDNFHIINLDLVFPIPTDILIKTLKVKVEIIIIEDQDGFVEHELKANLYSSIGCKISGKDIFPAYGEINIEQIYTYFTERFLIDYSHPETVIIHGEIPERLGTFCEGCPHRAVFYVLDKIIRDIPGIIGGDIGCSSLPPFRADWLMCMNAGIGISQGISQIETGQVVFSTGGDGSFFHAGLISLQNAVKNGIDLIHLVLDNKTVAMTGHQTSPSADKKFRPDALLKAIGVQRVYRVKATDTRRLERILRSESGRKGVRVVWVTGNCSRIENNLIRLKKKYLEPVIDSDYCGDCRICYVELACPAIIQISENGTLAIDLNTCERCGTCRNICPRGAIYISFKRTASNVLRQL